MTESNRVQITLCRETTPGTTPGTPRMRKVRFTDFTPNFAPNYLDPAEVRDDRMMSDPIPGIKQSGLTLPYELSFPDDESPMSELYRSAFYNPWVNSPYRANDGIADSNITDVAATGGVFTVSSEGDPFVAGQLIRTTGFTNSGNNGLFKVTTGSDTAPAVGNSLLTNEAAPPAAARIKVVGIQGAEGDLVAVSDGITSALLTFTNFPELVVGKVIKIGGTGAGYRFATEANNGYARIIAVAAHKLTLDSLPVGWTADTGEYAELRIYVPDEIRNGTTQTAVTVEVGYLGQQTPTYIPFRGQTVGQLTENTASGAKVTGTATMTGMSAGPAATSSLDASPDAVTLGAVMAANAHVGKVWEGGSRISSPNWCRSLNWTINNNVRTVEAIDEDSPVAVQAGSNLVTVDFETYFGGKTLLDKFHAGTPTSIMQQIGRDNQALVRQFPRVTYRGNGNPTGHQINNDVMLPLQGQASKDPLTGAQIIFDRFEYVEA